MCIRDRVSDALMEQLIEWQQRFHWNFDIHLLTVRDFLGKDCLLYTSDAADERSSVDLGGRRIIKKKKKRKRRNGAWTLTINAINYERGAEQTDSAKGNDRHG